MLTWLLTEIVPASWQTRLGEALFGGNFHDWLPCPCECSFGDDEEEDL